jgi:FKBP-type peptidyl-prolyl cis-trans isomerase
MSTSKGERVIAFLLASLFLFTTLGATGYVLWEINQGDGGLVQEDVAAPPPVEDTTQDCGQGQIAPVDPRPVPTVTTAETPVAELETVDVRVGSGEPVQPGDCVTVLYYGTLAETGESFDGNYESGAAIELSLLGVIAGWQEGIPGMQVGGVRRLIIPAELGYGEQGSGSIPANSDLVFEVEVLTTRRGE